MKMNMGRESIGYQLKSLMAALKLMSPPPCPHRRRPQKAPTNPITAKTRWPVAISSIIEENISNMMKIGSMALSAPFEPVRLSDSSGGLVADGGAKSRDDGAAARNRREADFVELAAARTEEVLHELRERLHQHEGHAAGHDDLDRGHVRRPDGMVALAELERVGRALDAAPDEHPDVEEQEDARQDVGEGAAARAPARVEEVHAHMRAVLHREGRADQ